jgi:hypothetical protein
MFSSTPPYDFVIWCLGRTGTLRLSKGNTKDEAGGPVKTVLLFACAPYYSSENC